MNERYPYPIKNWKNKCEYLRETPSFSHVEPTKYDLNFWRWEFLRRNANYQKFYNSYEKFTFDLNHKIEGNLSYFGLFFYINPVRDCGYQSLPPLCNIHKFPSFEENEKYKKEYEKYTDEKALTSLFMEFESVQKKGGVFVSIDLNLPLEIQLEKIKRLLSDEELIKKKQTIRNVRPNEWINYLRILDAYADNIKIDDIASEIYPEKRNEYPEYQGSDTVRKAYKKAIQLTVGFAIGGEKTDTNGIVQY